MKSAKPHAQGRQTAEERRDAVLDAAVIEFAAFGLHGASTERIAERVGISQPYIFRLFGTKKELFMAAVDRVADRIMVLFREAATREPTAALRAMGHAFDQLMTQRDELVLLLQAFAAAKDPDACRVGRMRIAEIYTYVARTSGASDDELRAFFAHGMLLMVAASMDLAAIAETEDWARILTSFGDMG